KTGLHSFALPVATPEITVSLLWHPRLAADPAHRWLRACVRGDCRRPYVSPDTPAFSSKRRAVCLAHRMIRKALHTFRSDAPTREVCHVHSSSPMRLRAVADLSACGASEGADRIQPAFREYRLHLHARGRRFSLSAG